MLISQIIYFGLTIVSLYQPFQKQHNQKYPHPSQQQKADAFTINLRGLYRGKKKKSFVLFTINRWRNDAEEPDMFS